MGYRTDFIWILPPDSTYDEVDRLMRDLRRIHRWQRFKDRVRSLLWT